MVLKNRRVAPDAESSFGAQFSTPSDEGSGWWRSVLMSIIGALIVAVVLWSSIAGWHEARQGSDFAYNAEKYAKINKLRNDARRTCDPFYLQLSLSDPQAASLISDFIHQNLSPQEHRELCLFIADPPSPSPPPMVIFSESAEPEVQEDESMELTQGVCAHFGEFPFEKICDEEYESYIIEAICSCAPEPIIV